MVTMSTRCTCRNISVFQKTSRGDGVGKAFQTIGSPVDNAYLIKGVPGLKSRDEAFRRPSNRALHQQVFAPFSGVVSSESRMKVGLHSQDTSVGRTLPPFFLRLSCTGDSSILGSCFFPRYGQVKRV